MGGSEEMRESDRRETVVRQIGLCCLALEDRKADDIIVLDLRGLSSITDYFVIASGKSEPHLKALRAKLEEAIKEMEVELIGIDAEPRSGWMVVDAFDFMVHLFLPAVREQYRLESLWKDAPLVKLEELAVV